MNVRYQASYKWIGASRLAVNLGNFLENGQQKEATVQFDFTKIYQKSKWIRQLDQPSNKADQQRWRNRITIVKDSVLTKSGKKVLKKKKIVDRSAVPYVSNGLKVFGKLATSLKQINLTASENASTRLPGYMDSTVFFGQNFKSMSPGFDFILGRQPDINWLNQKASNGLIAKDSNFNSMLQQNLDQKITLTAQLEPVRDLNISINLSKSFTKNYSETFRYIDTTFNGQNPTFKHLNPYAGGSFEVTYIAFNTLFGKFNPNLVSSTFKTFESNRIILSERLGKLNPYTNNQVGADGYYYGYCLCVLGPL
jgi:cell surface protein SprA